MTTALHTAGGRCCSSTRICTRPALEHAHASSLRACMRVRRARRGRGDAAGPRLQAVGLAGVGARDDQDVRAALCARVHGRPDARHGLLPACEPQGVAHASAVGACIPVRPCAPGQRVGRAGDSHHDGLLGVRLAGQARVGPGAPGGWRGAPAPHLSPPSRARARTTWAPPAARSRAAWSWGRRRPRRATPSQAGCCTATMKQARFLCWTRPGCGALHCRRACASPAQRATAPMMKQ
jgi:hypothetical protein